MRRLGIVAVGLALVVGIIMGGMVGNRFGGAAASAQQPTISLAGVPGSVAAGEPAFDVDISVAAVTNLGAYEWQLPFDPAVVEFIAATNGPFLGSTGRTVLCVPAIVGPSHGLEPGNVRFACGTLYSAPPGPDGAGLLSTATFSPIGNGAPAIELVCAGLSDPLGEGIAVSNMPPCGAPITPTPAPTPVPQPNIIPAGSSSATVLNGAVSSTSHITVTLTTDPRRSVCRMGRCFAFGSAPAVSWIEPRVGEGFVVHLTGPVGRDTTFTYRIEAAGY